MYPSNCDDIDISNGVIATCCYGSQLAEIASYETVASYKVAL